MEAPRACGGGWPAPCPPPPQLVEPGGDGEAVCALALLDLLPGWRARRLILGNGVPAPASYADCFFV